MMILHAPLPRYFMIGLLVLWGVFLFGGFVFGNSSETHRMPTWMRMASSTTLVVAGWSWFWVSRGSGIRPFPLYIALGMTFGLLGDLILADLLPGGRSVPAGILSFGIGHILYIIGILQFGNQQGLNAGSLRWGTLIVWLMIGVVGWYFVVYRGQSATILHWIALPYALLLAGTTGFATGLAFQSTLFVPFACGAALFLFSDLILAAELFNGLKFRSIGDVIWLTYGPGQMLIVYAIGAAMRFSSYPSLM
ncbi:MAG: lysoplasmalogenase [Chloroflexi bacterium]|nr:MAG: lysoplasmalogenase [Chloroflexota bacterium]